MRTQLFKGNACTPFVPECGDEQPLPHWEPQVFCSMYSAAPSTNVFSRLFPNLCQAGDNIYFSIDSRYAAGKTLFYGGQAGSLLDMSAI